MHHLSYSYNLLPFICLACLSMLTRSDPQKKRHVCVRVYVCVQTVCLSVHPSVHKPNQVKLANGLLPRCLGGGRTRKPYHARDLLPHHASLPLFWPRYALNRTRLLHESGV